MTPFPPPTPTQARLLWAAASALAIGVLCLMIGLVVWAAGYALNLLAPVLWPLACGGIFAYLLDPVVDLFERRGLSRGRAVVLVFALCFLVLAGFVSSVVPQLVRETSRLASEVPAYSRQLQHDLNRWMSARPVFDEWRIRFFGNGESSASAQTNSVGLASSGSVTNPPPPAGPEPGVAVTPAGEASGSQTDLAAQISSRVLQWVAQMLPRVGGWLANQLSRVASFAGTALSLALFPVFAYYFLREKAAIVDSWTKYLPVRESRFKEELVFIIQSINNYLITFFRGQVVVALCIGILLTIGFLVIGLDYAVLLGLMAGVLNIIPYLGALLTIIPAIALAAVEFRDWLHPVLVVGIFGLVQLIEGFVISPRIMGDRVGLHPLTIIIALMVGATLLGGILGGILAIPLTAALRVMMFRYVWKRRSKEA